MVNRAYTTTGELIDAISERWRLAYVILSKTKILYQIILNIDMKIDKSLRKDMQTTIDEIDKLFSGDAE